MKDLLVQSRFRNLLLWDLMAGRTAGEVAEECGLHQTTFGSLLNLKDSPFSHLRGDETEDAYRGTVRPYRPAAIRIADHFHILPEILFPESLYSLCLPDRVEREFSSVELLPLLTAGGQQYALPSPDELSSNDLQSVLDVSLSTLRPRTEAVLRYRFGLDGPERSLGEIAELLNLSRERIRQIEAKGLRQLRHSTRQKKLKVFAGAR